MGNLREPEVAQRRIDADRGVLIQAHQDIERVQVGEQAGRADDVRVSRWGERIVVTQIDQVLQIRLHQVDERVDEGLKNGHCLLQLVERLQNRQYPVGGHVVRRVSV